MYTKYKSGVINYDVICTSDYMVEKMMQEGEAQKIDTSSMEYYKNIDEKYLDFCKAWPDQWIRSPLPLGDRRNPL